MSLAKIKGCVWRTMKVGRTPILNSGHTVMLYCPHLRAEEVLF